MTLPALWQTCNGVVDHRERAAYLDPVAGLDPVRPPGTRDRGRLHDGVCPSAGLGPGGEMEIRTFEEWLRFCRQERERAASRDVHVLGTAWGSDTITPPPALEDPAARLPLERAREWERAAREAESPDRWRACLRIAIRWLSHPHPCTSPPLLRLLRAERRRLESALQEVQETP